MRGRARFGRRPRAVVTALDPPVLDELYARLGQGQSRRMRCDICRTGLEPDGPGAIRMAHGRLLLCCHAAACLDRFQEYSAATGEAPGSAQVMVSQFEPDDVEDRLA